MRFIPVILSSILLAACASLPRTPFTAQQQLLAQIPGIPDARHWADASRAELSPILHMADMQRVAKEIGALDLLAISGGASDGAFAAGVINGLTEAGKRPEFVFVSGVSAGALIAPLAFLGPEYDDELRLAWTSGLAGKLAKGGIFSILFSQESRRIALYELVSSFVDKTMLKAVAREHRRGRRLAVVTTNIDAQRPVIWNLGAIAASGHPNALELFRNVLTASSSIPGAFAPTAIEVEAGGKRFSELHVDGGATMQVFTIPDAILLEDLPKEKNTYAVPSSFYIIINNRLKPEFEVVKGAAIPLLSRSLSSLIKTHSRLTLLATMEFTKKRKIGFNLTYIDDDFPSDQKPSFDTGYMRAVYEYGHRKSAGNKVWRQNIPFVQAAPSRKASRSLSR